jgi:hypothetical protein
MKNREKANESRLRRALARAGYALRKDRARTASLDHAGGYMITRDNMIQAGEKYNLELVDVAVFVQELK